MLTCLVSKDWSRKDLDEPMDGIDDGSNDIYPSDQDLPEG